LNFSYELAGNSWSSLYNTEYTLRTLDYSEKKNLQQPMNGVETGFCQNK